MSELIILSNFFYVVQLINIPYELIEMMVVKTAIIFRNTLRTQLLQSKNAEMKTLMFMAEKGSLWWHIVTKRTFIRHQMKRMFRREILKELLSFVMYFA